MTEPTDARPPDADPRPLLRRCADQAVTILAALRPDDLERPTPCAEFDVRTLAGHVLSVLRGVAVVTAGGHVPTRCSPWVRSPSWPAPPPPTATGWPPPGPTTPCSTGGWRCRSGRCRGGRQHSPTAWSSPRTPGTWPLPSAGPTSWTRRPPPRCS